MERGGGDVAHDGSWQSTTLSLVGGDEGRFDTGLQADGSDIQGVAAWRWG
jgi:hypothetical protein